MGNICQDGNVQGLEIIGSYEEGLERNLSNHASEVPEKGYAIRVYDCPVLKGRPLEILTQQLAKQPFNADEYKGIELPPFFIHRKQLYYQGEWRNRIPHGKGKIYFPDGSYFEGYFSEGEAESTNGILIFNDGSYYRGEVVRSELSGKGMLVSSTGVVYEGDWVRNKPEGMGREIFSDGNSYEGGFVDGLKEGNGAFKWSDGRTYEGSFVKGKMTGQGTFYRGVREIYVGPFVDNKKVGNGKVKTNYGTYTGQFEDGLFSGNGKFVWKDNKVYEGGFKKGKMDGEGVLQFPNGQVLRGIWKQGQHTELVQLKVSKSSSKPNQ